MANETFDGLRVLALERRRAREIAKLVSNLGGVCMVAPSVREVPLESNQDALEFTRKLQAGEIDIAIFTTGVGVKALVAAAESACSREVFTARLNEIVVIARGPKPTAALRELGVRVSLSVPEPNTWRDLLGVLDERKTDVPLVGKRVAVQEYGVNNPELNTKLRGAGRDRHVCMRLSVGITRRYQTTSECSRCHHPRRCACSISFIFGADSTFV